jgi:signal peptidase I
LTEHGVDSEIQGVLGEMWQEACNRGRSLSFRIVSDSMSPIIEVGNVVRVSHVEPSDVRFGDIVAFRDNRNVVVHRVIGRYCSDKQPGFYHGGDFTSVSGQAHFDDIIGRVTAIQKGRREIRLDTPGQIMINRVMGWRLRLVNILGQTRPRFISIALHQALRPPWKLCRSLLLWIR